MNHDLHAGFGLRDITPSGAVPMSGFAIRTEPSTGAHDPLFVRTLRLDDGVHAVYLVIFDLIGVDARLSHAVRDAVALRTDVAADDVVVLATHTHGGPAVLDRAHLGAPDAAYRRGLAELAADAAEDAARDARSTRIGYAEGVEATIAHNRRVAGGPIDPAVRIVAFERGDRVVGVLASYACHPVTLGPGNRQLTRDYPGFLVDRLSAAFPGAFTAFATGLCGQINTGHDAYASQRHGDGPKRSYAEAERIGRRLADVARSAVEHEVRPVSGSLRMARTEIELPFAPLPRDPATDAVSWRAERASLGDDDSARAALLDAWIAWADAHPGAVPDARRSEVACLGLGPLVIAFYPGEIFVEYGHDLAEAHPGRFVVPLAYAHDAPGYLPRPDAFAAGGYEVAEAYRIYGEPAPYAPQAADEVQRAVEALAHEVAS